MSNSYTGFSFVYPVQKGQLGRAWETVFRAAVAWVRESGVFDVDGLSDEEVWPYAPAHIELVDEGIWFSHDESSDPAFVADLVSALQPEFSEGKPFVFEWGTWCSKPVLGRAAFKLLNAEGIGYYRVFDNDSGRIEVVEQVPPSIRREFYDDARRWHSRCCAENAAGASVAKAGTRDGGYWTPFRHTMDDVKRALQDAHGRMVLKDLMAKLPDGRGHYVSSATCRASLLHLIGTKVIPWARVVRDGRTVYIELKRDEEE